MVKEVGGGVVVARWRCVVLGVVVGGVGWLVRCLVADFVLNCKTDKQCNVGLY